MNAIDKFTIDTVGAISELVKEGFYTQALIILYSAIDTMAWINLSEGDVKQKDFVEWVNKYMQPENNLGCTAGDLYGARCGLVHANTSVSRKSRTGEVAQIWYVTSPKSFNKLQEHVIETRTEARVVYFTALFAIFIEACQQFNVEISVNKTRQHEVNDRIQHWIGFAPLKETFK